MKCNGLAVKAQHNGSCNHTILNTA